MADDNQGGFKITDRRIFNADGTLREDAVIEEAPVVEPAPAPATPPAPPIESESTVAEAYVEAYYPEDEGPAAEVEDDAGGMPERTLFTEFLMQIASSAFIYLGLVEHPATGRLQVDLEAARESIDILDMLREKTQGNLTRGEEKFFDEILSDLKMQFVARQR